MAKEKVYIVLSHKHTLKKKSRTEWEVAETVEFVNQLKNRHYQSSSAIADYLGSKMITGARFGMDDYSKFDGYVRSKYAEQMKQLDKLYGREVVEPEVTEEVITQEAEPITEPEVITDQFGNTREKTVFDQ
jgi:hypothetical protein